jgi:hypothetical protein
MDQKNKISSFEEIGMTDPFKKKDAIADTISHVQTFDILTNVYPQHVVDKYLD